MSEDYTRDIEQVCDAALREARIRPLTENEIAALRWAAGIPEGRAAARERGKEIEHGTYCL